MAFRIDFLDCFEKRINKKCQVGFFIIKKCILFQYWLSIFFEAKNFIQTVFVFECVRYDNELMRSIGLLVMDLKTVRAREKLINYPLNMCVLAGAHSAHDQTESCAAASIEINFNFC